MVLSVLDAKNLFLVVVPMVEMAEEGVTLLYVLTQVYPRSLIYDIKNTFLLKKEDLAKVEDELGQMEKIFLSECL